MFWLKVTLASCLSCRLVCLQFIGDVWIYLKLKLIIMFVFFPQTGGETIKGISQQSGARIELQRNPPPNADPNIKMFTVRGSPQQIDYARQLVEEKIGVRRRADFNLPQDSSHKACNRATANLSKHCLMLSVLLC